ncbi:hypothetical protein ACG1BZ_13735 [Microbulbifer sp. CNSA002]|uniref:hypothetical protein n=1 Tax=Microbulbifer sp. CNSA002 TaxID=3373604 RepID=UPI0039B4B4E3
MVFFPFNLSGSDQPKLAGREQVGGSVRASHNQASQARPTPLGLGWTAYALLRLPLLAALDIITMTKYFTFLVAFFLLYQEANACSFSRSNEQETFDRAERVFRAKIIATKLVAENHDGDSHEVVNATYQLVESFKGDNPKTGLVKEIPFSPGNCMLGLLTGMEYVFFLKDNLFVTMPNGSWAYFNAEGTQVKPELEKLRGYAGKNM